MLPTRAARSPKGPGRAASGVLGAVQPVVDGEADEDHRPKGTGSHQDDASLDRESDRHQVDRENDRRQDDRHDRAEPRQVFLEKASTYRVDRLEDDHHDDADQHEVVQPFGR